MLRYAALAPLDGRLTRPAVCPGDRSRAGAARQMHGAAGSQHQDYDLLSLVACKRLPQHTPGSVGPIPDGALSMTEAYRATAGWSDVTAALVFEGQRFARASVSQV